MTSLADFMRLPWRPRMGHVAMESTGVYWWPVYHALAGERIEVCVCNAAHMRNVPGRKTGLRDCQWIAELHEYGLLRPSFIPAAEVAALRQRTRYRKKLIEQRISEGQRLCKVLENARIKIDSVASDLLGRVGPGHARGADRRRAEPGRPGGPDQGGAAPQDRGPADGLRRPVHRLARSDVPAAPARDHLSARIGGLDVLVAEAAAPFRPVIARLVTIPGIGQRTAEVIVAETGGDMARFASPARLAARAGLAPGDNESAGKRKHAAARQGNRHLRTALVESAWSTARTRSRPGARFRRLARRFGRGNEKKAAVAVAHTPWPASPGRS